MKNQRERNPVSQETNMFLLCFLSLTFIYNWELKQLDINNVFFTWRVERRCICGCSSWIDFDSTITNL